MCVRERERERGKYQFVRDDCIDIGGDIVVEILGSTNSSNRSIY
jgi:hypothetical protein